MPLTYVCAAQSRRRKEKALFLDIQLTPTPKLRPKFTVRHGRVHATTPYKTKFFENQVADIFKASNQEPFGEGEALKVIVAFYIEPPKSTTKRKRESMLSGELWPTVKPDLDNYVKAILDGLNGLAWHDDAQIVKITAQKQYDEKPHIALLVERV